MNPEDFLGLARSIVGSGDAAHSRCAIGRAYYAAFNVAAEALRFNPCVIYENAAAHGEVINYLRWSENHALIEAAAKIADLKNKWNVADYRMGDNPAVEKKANAEVQIIVAGSSPS